MPVKLVPDDGDADFEIVPPFEVGLDCLGSLIPTCLGREEDDELPPLVPPLEDEPLLLDCVGACLAKL